jgi:hypothetical protein
LQLFPEEERTMTRGSSIICSVAFALAAILPTSALAGDVVVQSGYCAASLSMQQVANAGITRIREIRGDNLHRRYIGKMTWQGASMVAGAEVHLFTCQLTNIVAPVTRSTPVYGRYAGMW